MKLDKKTWIIIAGVALALTVIIAVIAAVTSDKGKSAQNSISSSETVSVQEVISEEYNLGENQDSSSVEEFEAEPEQKGEMKIEDDTLTNKDLDLGRSWYFFDKKSDIVSESYAFMPDGTYTHRLRYSIKAGGKFINEKGTYSVPAKGELTLYPDGEQGVKYNYKIEENKLYIRKKGAEEWSHPFTMSDNV